MDTNKGIKTASLGILPVLLAFYVQGFGDIVGVATSYTQSEFELSNTLTQILTMLAFVWFALLSVPISVFQDRHSRKITVIIGIGFFSIAMLMPILFYNYYGMLLSFAFLGLGNAIVQVSSNPLIQDVSAPEKLSRNLTVSQFVKAIAGMLGPFIAASCAIYWGKWTIIYWIYLAICIINIIWLYVTTIQETYNTGSASVKGTLLLLKDRKIALVVLGTFVMVGFDVGMNTNIVKFLRSSFNLTQEQGTLGISVYFAALMFGRFFSAIILDKFKNLTVLIVSAILSLVSFCLMFVASSDIMAVVTIFMVGLFTSSLFPLIFSIGLQYKPERSNELSGLMIMSVCGGGIIPPILGVVSDMWNFKSAFFLYVLCLLYVLLFALKDLKNG